MSSKDFVVQIENACATKCIRRISRRNLVLFLNMRSFGDQASAF